MARGNRGKASRQRHNAERRALRAAARDPHAPMLLPPPLDHQPHRTAGRLVSTGESRRMQVARDLSAILGIPLVVSGAERGRTVFDELSEFLAAVPRRDQIQALRTLVAPGADVVVRAVLGTARRIHITAAWPAGWIASCALHSAALAQGVRIAASDHQLRSRPPGGPASTPSELCGVAAAVLARALTALAHALEQGDGQAAKAAYLAVREAARSLAALGRAQMGVIARACGAGRRHPVATIGTVRTWDPDTDGYEDTPVTLDVRHELLTNTGQRPLPPSAQAEARARAQRELDVYDRAWAIVETHVLAAAEELSSHVRDLPVFAENNYVGTLVARMLQLTRAHVLAALSRDRNASVIDAVLAARSEASALTALWPQRQASQAGMEVRDPVDDSVAQAISHRICRHYRLPEARVIRVDRQGRRRLGQYDLATGTITLYRGGHTVGTTLHELAHHVAWKLDRHPGHGAEFCGRFDELLAAWRAAEARCAAPFAPDITMSAAAD